METHIHHVYFVYKSHVVVVYDAAIIFNMKIFFHYFWRRCVCVCEFIYICCSFCFCRVLCPGNFQGKRIKHTTNDELKWIWKWRTRYTHDGIIYKCTKNSSLNNPWFSLSSFAFFFYYQCSTIFIAQRMLNMLCWNDVSVKSTSEQKKTFKMFIFFSERVGGPTVWNINKATFCRFQSICIGLP